MMLHRAVARAIVAGIMQLHWRGNSEVTGSFYAVFGYNTFECYFTHPSEIHQYVTARYHCHVMTNSCYLTVDGIVFGQRCCPEGVISLLVVDCIHQ